MKITEAQKQQLRLALNLAIQWEESLIDTNTSHPIYGPLDSECVATIKDSRRNVRRFQALKRLLDS